jgi:hypothetical protein
MLDAIKRLGRRVFVGWRDLCFVMDTMYSFCDINLLKFDFNFMYVRNKAKVAHELVSYCEDSFNMNFYFEGVVEPT